MKLIYTFLLLTFTFLGNAQLNMTLQSHVDFLGSGNDIWGYVAPDGTEYAIVGTTIGTRVYSLEDKTNPIERIFIPGSNSTWRDMKQWGEYVYVTADSGTDGLLIINMTLAPETIEYEYIHPVVSRGGSDLALDRCHNIYIDEKGLICLAGCQGGGVEFLDPTKNPMNPEVIGAIESPYSHDVYTKGDTLYASEIYDHLAIYDISDLNNIVLLGTQETSSDFTHNAWADPTHHYAFTTDERPEGFLDAYDVSDPANIVYLDKFMPPGKSGTGTIPHNTHYFNGYLVTSWYTSGVVVVDAHKPDNLVQVAHYDTYDGPDGGFSGCWGVTPYLPSGLLIANDINSGLYVFDIDYVRAAYLEGTITDIATNNPISNVEINIIGGDNPDIERSVANGQYKTGQVTEGTFMVEYTHPLYDPVVKEVVLTSGEVTIQDVQMGSLPFYNITIAAIDSVTKNPIPNAQFLFQNEGTEYAFKSDENGIASGEIVQGTYGVYAGVWGHKNIGLVDQEILADVSYSFELAPAYMDDYILDLGWTVENEMENNNFTGAWERVVPIGTFDGATIYNPEADVDGDVGNMCYVTENESGGTFFSSDVDNGLTRLISPSMDLTTYDNPIVEFRAWFVAGGGDGFPDDQLEFYVSNGSTSVLLMDYNTISQEWSNAFQFDLADYLEITDNMTVYMEVSDFSNNGHAVEAGIDNFFVRNSKVVSTSEVLSEAINIYPTPARDIVHFTIEGTEISSIEILNTLGQVVKVENTFSNQVNIDISDLANGTYYARIITIHDSIGTYPIQLIK